MFCDNLKVILEPGDVLFVPKKWWHYVESLETSISINTWIELVCTSISQYIQYTLICKLVVTFHTV